MDTCKFELTDEEILKAIAERGDYLSMNKAIAKAQVSKIFSMLHAPPQDKVAAIVKILEIHDLHSGESFHYEYWRKQREFLGHEICNLFHILPTLEKELKSE